MVTISTPAASSIVSAQDRIGWPSTWTVQAPQSPAPQPYLVPVSFSASRSAQRSGVRPSVSTSRVSPLTMREWVMA